MPKPPVENALKSRIRDASCSDYDLRWRMFIAHESYGMSHANIIDCKVTIKAIVSYAT